MNPVDRARQLFRRKSAYRTCFMGDGAALHGAGHEVIRDLMRFGYFTRSTTMVTPQGGVDPIATAHAEGRRQMLLRILAQLQLDDSAILEMTLETSHD